MENASKALIIAGAIILAILIITLGIGVYKLAIEPMGNTSQQMSDLDAQAFNTKFTQYEGNNVRGSNVNVMLQSVVSSNASQDDAARKVEVDLQGAGAKDSNR